MYIYLLTAIGLTPDGSSTVHIYTETIHRTQLVAVGVVVVVVVVVMIAAMRKRQDVT
jgi:hypothetical protein